MRIDRKYKTVKFGFLQEAQGFDFKYPTLS
jgi:hypothetical protein